MARLEGANLRKASLKEADLTLAHLKETNFIHARLKSANLHEANLEKANLSWAHLENAALSYVKLGGATLFGAHLEGASLRSANLSNTDLRDCKGLRFDDTLVLRSRLTPRPGNFFSRLLPWFIYNPVTDPWSELRRAYTGPNFLLTLLALIAFLLPYVVQIAAWRSVNLAQELTQQTLSDLRIDYETLAARGAISPSAAHVLESSLMNLEQYDTCLAESCTRYRIWQLLIGWNKGWLFVALALAVLLYNGVRYYLTQTIAAFREEEERSGYTPSLRAYFTPNLFGVYLEFGQTWKHKLTALLGLSPTRLHVVLRILFLLATSAFVVNLFEVLLTVVKLRS